MICSKCVLPSNFDNINFDANGVCCFCNNFSNKHDNCRSSSFLSEKELIEQLIFFKNNKKYDALVCLSGGVDSCNTLIEIKEKYGLNPLCYHYNNGYERIIAEDNVKNLCKELDVDLIIMQNDLKFMKKIWKYFNIDEINQVSGCIACGNILYLNALEIAEKNNINLVINGYSKGQAINFNDEEWSKSMIHKMNQVVKNSNDIEFMKTYIKKYDIVKRKFVEVIEKKLQL